MEIKCPCQHCGQNISFPANMTGDWLACPHCAQQTQLLNPIDLSSQSSSAVQKSRDPGWIFIGIGMLGLGVAYIFLVDTRFIEILRLTGDPNSGAAAKAHIVASVVESLASLAAGITAGIFVWFGLCRLSKNRFSAQLVMLVTTSVVLAGSVLKKHYDTSEKERKVAQLIAQLKTDKELKEHEARLGLHLRDAQIKVGGIRSTYALTGRLENRSRFKVWQVEVRLRFRQKGTSVELDTKRIIILGSIAPGETNAIREDIYPPNELYDWNCEIIKVELWNY